MNSVFVYCEIEEGVVADVSLELLTKGRTLATELGVKLEAIVLGSDLKGVEKQLTVHPNLPPQPRKGMGQTHEHDVMHTKDQHQHQCGFGKFPGREQQVF